MNSSHFSKEIISELQTLNTNLSGGVSVSGTDLTDIKTNTLDTATNTADLVVNTGIVAAAVNISGFLSTDIASINGTATAANSGNLSSGTQRVCIATNDVNLSSINTNTSGVSSSLTNIDTSLTDVPTVIQSMTFMATPWKGFLTAGVNPTGMAQPLALTAGGSLKCDVAATEDLNFLSLLHIPRPLSVTSYPNTKYFLVGGGYHDNVNTGEDYLCPKMTTHADDHLSAVAATYPPGFDSGICYAISSSASDNGSNVTLKYWDDSGVYQTASGNLIGTNKATDYLTLGTDVRTIDEFYMTSVANVGEVFLYLPSALVPAPLYAQNYYNTFIPINAWRTNGNLSCGLPLNSRIQLGVLHGKASAEVSNISVWKITLIGSSLELRKLWQGMITSVCPLVNVDLSYLGYFYGPTSAANYSAICVSSRCIGPSPSTNSMHLGLKVEF